MRHGRRDSTHAEIREELRALGATVADTGDLGRDFPDLVAGFCGASFLVEAKAAKGELSDGQSEFARAWRGSPVVVLRSREQAREWYLRTRHELTRSRSQPCAHRDLTPVVHTQTAHAERIDGRYTGPTRDGG